MHTTKPLTGYICSRVPHEHSIYKYKYCSVIGLLLCNTWDVECHDIPVLTDNSSLMLILLLTRVVSFYTTGTLRRVGSHTKHWARGPGDCRPQGGWGPPPPLWSIADPGNVLPFWGGWTLENKVVLYSPLLNNFLLCEGEVFKRAKNKLWRFLKGYIFLKVDF